MTFCHCNKPTFSVADRKKQKTLTRGISGIYWAGKLILQPFCGCLESIQRNDATGAPQNVSLLRSESCEQDNAPLRQVRAQDKGIGLS